MKKGAPITPGQTVAAEAVKRISMLYYPDNTYKGSSAQERFDNRQRSVKPLIDAYFAWLKTLQRKSNASSKLKDVINYSLNQEVYLGRFLKDPLLPMLTMMQNVVTSPSVLESISVASLIIANSHFLRPAGPHFPAS